MNYDYGCKKLTFQTFPFALLTATTVRAESKQPPFTRENYNVCTVEYIVSGRGYLDINGHSAELGPDSIYFLHKGSNHTYAPERQDPWVKSLFVVDGPLMEELFRIYKLDQVYWIRDARELKSYFEFFEKLNLADPRIHERGAVIFHEFVEACSACISRSKNPVPEKVLELRRTLEGALDQKFTLEEYCREKGYSPAYMIRLFHKHYGSSPMEYLLELRCQKAQRLLRYSHLTIKEVAAMLNFSDQYHLSNFIRKRTGYPPSFFREPSGKR